MAAIIILDDFKKARAAVATRIGIDYSNLKLKRIEKSLRRELESSMAPDDPEFRKTLAQEFDLYVMRIGLD